MIVHGVHEYASSFGNNKSIPACACKMNAVLNMHTHTHTCLPSSADTFLTSQSAQTSPPSPLELYVSYLKDVYKKDPFPTHDKWPQVKESSSTSLSSASVTYHHRRHTSTPKPCSMATSVALLQRRRWRWQTLPRQRMAPLSRAGDDVS